MKQPFPAIVLPFHASLAGYRVVAFSGARANDVVIIGSEACEAHAAFFNGARIHRHRGADIYLLVRGDEAMAWNQASPIEEITLAGNQRVLPGAERDGGASIARKRIREPMRGRKPQEACDVGLFDDAARNQTSLF